MKLLYEVLKLGPSRCLECCIIITGVGFGVLDGLLMGESMSHPCLDTSHWPLAFLYSQGGFSAFRYCTFALWVLNHSGGSKGKWHVTTDLARLPGCSNFKKMHTLADGVV